MSRMPPPFADILSELEDDEKEGIFYEEELMRELSFKASRKEAERVPIDQLAAQCNRAVHSRVWREEEI